MPESLHDHMKVGLVHFMAFPQCMGGEGPVADTVEKIARDPFFEILEITHVAFDDEREKVKAIAEQSRLELGFGAQPILLGGQLDLNHVDDAERTKAIDAVKAGMDEAASINIDTVAVLSGKVCEDREAGKLRLTSSLIELCDHAQTHGQHLLLETFDQVPYGKNCLIGPTVDAVEVSTEVRGKHPGFGLLLDLSHLPLIGESSRDALTRANDHLNYVHIGNCAMDDPDHPAYGDNHPRFGAPGTRNDVDELSDFLRVLFDIGYLGDGIRRPVSFEVKPMPAESSEDVIAGSKRALQEAWRRI